MKKLFILLLTTICFSSFPAAAFGQTPTYTQKMQEKINLQAAELSNRQTTLKDRADREIDRRTASLNNFITRINNMKKLSSDQKISLVTQIQTEITNLTNLKTKIDNDTNTFTLKADVQSIIVSYRVFALFMPKLAILAASDRILETADNMSSIAAKLQTRITEASSKGKDVSSLQASMSDILAKIADARLQANNANSSVLPLTPDGFPANKTILQSARGMITTGIQDLNAARQDIRSIIEFLRNGKTPIKTSSENATQASTTTNAGQTGQ